MNGRYLVGDKQCPSLSAAIAYAGHRAAGSLQPCTFYVREIGMQGVLFRVERHPDKTVTIHRGG